LRFGILSQAAKAVPELYGEFALRLQNSLGFIAYPESKWPNIVFAGLDIEVVAREQESGRTRLFGADVMKNRLV